MSGTFSAHRADKAFFATNPRRIFRARSYAEGDGPLPAGTALFSSDEDGNGGEINLVVVKRVIGARMRLLFTVRKPLVLNSDKAVIRFLLSRNIDSIRFKSADNL